jgi:hypothetical protein
MAKICVVFLPCRAPIVQKAKLVVSAVVLLLARVVEMRTADKLRTS